MSTQTKLTRRQFMTGCSAAIAALAGSQVSSLAFTPDAPNPEAIIVVFLRGGWDALNVVPPIAAGSDRGYYEAARPALKLATTGTNAAHQPRRLLRAASVAGAADESVSGATAGDRARGGSGLRHAQPFRRDAVYRDGHAGQQDRQRLADALSRIAGAAVEHRAAGALLGRFARRVADRLSQGRHHVEPVLVQPGRQLDLSHTTDQRGAHDVRLGRRLARSGRQRDDRRRRSGSDQRHRQLHAGERRVLSGQLVRQQPQVHRADDQDRRRLDHGHDRSGRLGHAREPGRRANELLWARS